MSLATRGARSALFRDFYDLIPLFSSFGLRPQPIVRRSARCVAVPIKRCIATTQRQRLQVDAQPVQEHSQSSPILVSQHDGHQLPLACPGCGALTQSVHEHDAGYYSTSRAAVKKYLNPSTAESSRELQAEDEVVRNALANVPRELREQFGMDSLEPSTGVLHPHSTKMQ
jgi:hypothetical protein